MAISGLYAGTTGHVQAEIFQTNGLGTIALVSSPVRIGPKALHFTTSGNTATVEYRRRLAGGTFSANYKSVKFWIRIDSLPTNPNPADIAAFCDTASNEDHWLTLNPSGTLTAGITASGSTSSTNAFTAGDGVSHAIEMDCGWNAGAGIKVYVDGVLWITRSTGTPAASAALQMGLRGSPTADIYIEHIVSYDDTFSGDVWYPDWRIAYLQPVSDNAIGNWTGGAGGVTSLFDAIDNIPPVGVANASATNTSQVKNTTAGASNNLDLNCTDYATAGLGPNDIIRAVQPVINQSATGAAVKAGLLQVISNPAGTSLTFDFEDGGGLNAGTFPTNWKASSGAVDVSPSVTLSTQPVLRIQKTTSSGQNAFVDQAGIYVLYSRSRSLPPFQRRWRYLSRKRVA